MITLGIPIIAMNYSNAMRNLDPSDPYTKWIALASLVFWGLYIIACLYILWRNWRDH